MNKWRMNEIRPTGRMWLLRLLKTRRNVCVKRACICYGDRSQFSCYSRKTGWTVYRMIGSRLRFRRSQADELDFLQNSILQACERQFSCVVKLMLLLSLEWGRSRHQREWFRGDFQRVQVATLTGWCDVSAHLWCHSLGVQTGFCGFRRKGRMIRHTSHTQWQSRLPMHDVLFEDSCLLGSFHGGISYSLLMRYALRNVVSYTVQTIRRHL